MNTNSVESRRRFFKTAALGALATISMPQIVSAAMPPAEKVKVSTKKTKLAKEAVILFQGDSITDAGRRRDDAGFNNVGALGSGYAFLTSAKILAQYADKDFKIYNRGVSGNKVYQSAESWDKDCIDIKPDVLSVLIGVNDFWHTLSFGYDGTLETYVNDYTALLKRTKEALPNVKLIIGEPFAVNGTSAVNDSWFPAFDEYRAAAKNIAKQFGAVFIPYHSVFAEAQKVAHGAYWVPDGVHPSLAGAELMAEAWMQAFNSL